MLPWKISYWLFIIDNSVCYPIRWSWRVLTHWGRVTHICVSKLTIIGSDNGLSPGRRQAIVWTNAGILLIRPLGTNISETSIKIHIFSFKKMHLKMSSGKWWPFCLGLNVLMSQFTDAYLRHWEHKHAVYSSCHMVYQNFAHTIFCHHHIGDIYVHMYICICIYVFYIKHTKYWHLNHCDTLGRLRICSGAG